MSSRKPGKTTDWRRIDGWLAPLVEEAPDTPHEAGAKTRRLIGGIGHKIMPGAGWNKPARSKSGEPQRRVERVGLRSIDDIVLVAMNEQEGRADAALHGVAQWGRLEIALAILVERKPD